MVTPSLTPFTNTASFPSQPQGAPLWSQVGPYAEGPHQLVPLQVLGLPDATPHTWTLFPLVFPYSASSQKHFRLSRGSSLAFLGLHSPDLDVECQAPRSPSNCPSLCPPPLAGANSNVQVTAAPTAHSRLASVCCLWVLEPVTIHPLGIFQVQENRGQVCGICLAQLPLSLNHVRDKHVQTYPDLQ